MTTVIPDRHEDEKADEKDAGEHGGLPVVRATYLLAGVALFAIVLLTLLNIFADIDGTVSTGIAAIGMLMTAAFGIGALHLRGR